MVEGSKKHPPSVNPRRKVEYRNQKRLFCHYHSKEIKNKTKQDQFICDYFYKHLVMFFKLCEVLDAYYFYFLFSHDK